MMMKDESFEYEQIYEHDVEFAFLNEYGTMKPSAYQVLFAQLAERHLSFYQADTNETMRHGLSWALISISVEIARPIDRCMKLYAKTWYSGRSGPYFRRELIFSNESGDVMFQGSTFSVLLDVANRSVFRKRELPFVLAAPREIVCVDASPRHREEGSFLPAGRRIARPSDIDNLSHVNNRRYGDFAYDALSDDEVVGLNKLSRIDYYFVTELQKGDEFKIEKSSAPERIGIRGTSLSKNELSFVVLFHFQEQALTAAPSMDGEE